MPGKRPPGMWENLLVHAYGNRAEMDKSHAAFLRSKWAERDHGFLLAAIRASNLHPGAKAVLTELIQDKLKRAPHRPASADTELRHMQIALSVLDFEVGGDVRKAAISKTVDKLGCGKRTIEKALSEHEQWLKSANSADLDWLRNRRT